MLDGAFLIVWHDLAPDAEAEFNRFHRIEHMPERLEIPGFTLGRRYVDPGSTRHRYLTLYEVTSPGVFESEIYKTRLASMTPWTQRMQPQLRNFVRRVCRTRASDGLAAGAAAATFWLRAGGATDDQMAADLVGHAMGEDGVAAAHVGLVDEAATNIRKDEMQNRAAGSTEDFNGVLIVECDCRATLAGLMPALSAHVATAVGSPAVASHLYDLALLYRPTWKEAAVPR